ncbi:hypothetical protein ACRQ1B_18545 [Rhizobium panacihumi]|uniref:cysteine dioxygenase family protein n=1 Tax=Rhizobium panacihumi TaxID=2008450 RepID=UPI003D7AC3DF
MNREKSIEEALARVRTALAGGVDRETLEAAKEALVALAANREFWTDAQFPAPGEDERQARYLIAQDDAEGLTLYLNVMLPGKKIPPHNHTTWACIAAVEGEEENTLYRRLDDGSEAGKAKLEIDRTISVSPGTGIAMLPDDIHHVEIKGDRPIRHLHLYGRPLETLTARLTFDLAAGTSRAMPVGVKTR